MIHLTLITVGDLPKGPFAEIGNEFKKRLGPYVKLDHRVVASAEKVEKQIPEGDFIIVLDERGKLMSSKQAAQAIQWIENQGQHITVIIGGPKGLPVEIKKKAKLLLALSPMTTTHDLAHIFFLEQLYRVMTILRGKEYHY
ncbi:MAG: 23S rRNA (pseudouridine(1915)-N(3))-methyltransferase RlmH [Candidatus Uhrbacteria bacterium]|nr:23S rRNA (pseudouridine(1915)-N(3))-methyltransferase RlmH [Candidatus Uhrbacteria bacterium]